MPTIPFDNYEIHGCIERNSGPGYESYVEQCPDEEAQFWSLFGHCPKGGVEAIGDFATREDAEAMFQRIAGIPFGSHDEIAARVRLMHAAPSLLSDLEDAVFELEQWMEVYPDGSDRTQDVIDSARQTIAEATFLKLKPAA